MSKIVGDIVVAAVVSATVVLLALMIQGFLLVSEKKPYSFLQRDFPCQEDEYLGFHQRFGPDKVGCIHIDEVSNR